GSDAPDGLDRGERVADRARAREQVPAALLARVQVYAADGLARLVLAVEGEHERGDRDAERDQHGHAEQHRALPESGFGVQRLTCAARTAAHRDEEDAEPEE